MPDNSDKIKLLERILESGAHSISVDGVTTTYRDRQSIVSEIRRLEGDDADVTTSRRVKSINLGAF